MADGVTEVDVRQFEREVVEAFECPDCGKYMLPPIRQCASGHSFCNNCFDTMKRCKICNLIKTRTRIHLLEKMQEYLKFPCKYKNFGCTFYGKGHIVPQHQNNCEYSKYACPLGFRNCMLCDMRESQMHCTNLRERNVSVLSSIRRNRNRPRRPR
ncbi:unnamed protein product [Acanthoscelides obtectus]|uniref:GATA-type domain-containing protein n=1 Tax=Acanthoscelides obtectus TaxID=200917 RepID=A0A9P0L7K9_ACAOB|nr:unnamed protein product [Acanthoscelides obtectus]CAH2001931.1 unnamed protein product [Acanthoscelides obtectus]CAK1669112.1 E3 ubiquitin-protein ligase siah2 [Acanthoscelides obtectus]CAK1670167.1 E3 ubiquitin-protein ligase siah2 [Acanthoscelides obtectus]